MCPGETKGAQEKLRGFVLRLAFVSGHTVCPGAQTGAEEATKAVRGPGLSYYYELPLCESL